MEKSKKWMIAGILLLCVSVLLGSLFIGLSVGYNKEMTPVLTIGQASQYTGLSTQEINDIIIWEEGHPEYFSNAVMKLPYYTVKTKKYFTTKSLDSWMNNVATRENFNNFISLNSGWR